MRRALTNAELTALLQHTLEVHAGQQVVGSLPGTVDEQNRGLLVSVGVTLWMQYGHADEDGEWRERRAEALRLSEEALNGEPETLRPFDPTCPARRSLAWQVVAELGVQDDTASLLTYADILNSVSSTDGMIPRLDGLKPCRTCFR